MQGEFKINALFCENSEEIEKIIVRYVIKILK